MEDLGAFIDERLHAILAELSQALIGYTPEHFKTIVFTIKAAGNASDPSLVYRIECPDFPDQGTNDPGAEVHAAGSKLFAHFTKGGKPFTGLKLVLRQNPDGSWGNAAEPLGAAPAPAPDEDKSDLQASLREADASIQANPSDPYAWSLKADLLALAGRDQEALECASRAVELNPKHRSAWQRRGRLLMKLGRPAQALGSFETHLTIRPNSGPGWLDKGACEESLRQGKAAEASYRKCLELASGPDDSELAARARAGLERARSL